MTVNEDKQKLGKLKYERGRIKKKHKEELKEVNMKISELEKKINKK